MHWSCNLFSRTRVSSEALCTSAQLPHDLPMNLKDLHCTVKKQNGCLMPAHPPQERFEFTIVAVTPFQNQTLDVCDPTCLQTSSSTGVEIHTVTIPPHCDPVTSSMPDYAVGAKTPESTLRWSASCSNAPESLGLPRQAWMSPGTHRPQTQVTLLKIWPNAGKVAKNCQMLNCAHIHFKKALPAYKQSPVRVGWKSMEWQLTGWLLQPAINCSFQVKMVPLILFAWFSSKLHIRRLPFLTEMSNNLPNSPIHTGFNSNFI